MTGPEHYAEAERLLAHADVESLDPMRKYVEDGIVIGAAQVHATLALAAATARPGIVSYHGDANSDDHAWSKVTAPKREAQS